MSNVLKVPGCKGIKATITMSKEVAGKDEELDGKLIFEKQLEENYERGFKIGYKEASKKLEKEMTDELISKSEEFYKILSAFEEKIIAYEEAFDKIVITVTRKICEKLLKRELEKKTIIESTLRESVSKILGANEITIKLNPKDYSLITNEKFSNEIEKNFMKIKIENDKSIEIGGCLIQTDIGNVDGRVSAQLKEIITQLENNLVDNVQ